MLKRRDQKQEELLAELRELKGSVADLRSEKKRLESAAAVQAEIVTLKRELTDLDIKKDRASEKHEREQRELKHMIGLEKKRQEVETAHAKRDATLTVREENLQAERDRFEEQVQFNTDRFESEVKYLKDMVSQVLDRLPTVTVDRAITAPRVTAKR